MNTPTTFPPDVAPLVERIMAICREQLTEGAVTPVTYVIDSKEQLLVPVEQHMPAKIATDIAGAMVRWTATTIHADMTIAVSEAWSLSSADSPRYREIIDQYGSIGDYPGKLDVLMVNVQTRAGCWRGRAPIETRGQARRCGALEVIRVEPPPASFLDDPVR